MSERVYFTDNQQAYTIKGLKSIQALAVLRERSKVNGVVDRRLMFAHTLELGISEPRLSFSDVLKLMDTHPQSAARLFERIVKLTMSDP